METWVLKDSVCQTETDAFCMASFGKGCQDVSCLSLKSLMMLNLENNMKASFGHRKRKSVCVSCEFISLNSDFSQFSFS